MSEDETISPSTSDDSEVKVILHDETTKECGDCEQKYPLNLLYFSRSGKSYSRLCHECLYKQKVSDGKSPRFPAKNGVDQKEFHKELAEAAKKDKPPTKDPSPWLKASSGAVTESSTSPPPPGQGKTVKVFNLEPVVKRDPNGVFVLTINDYFKFQKFHRIPDEQPQNSYSRPASSSPVDNDDRESEECDDEEGDEEGEDAEDDEMPMDPSDIRRALIVSIATYPHIAAHLQLTYDAVHERDDYQVWKDYQTFNSLKVMHSGTDIAHAGIKAVADVVEKVATGKRLPGGSVIDLRGLQQELDDPNFVATVREVIDVRQQIVSKVEPEYRLLAHFALKMYSVNSRNQKLRQISQQQ